VRAIHRRFRWWRFESPGRKRFGRTAARFLSRLARPAQHDFTEDEIVLADVHHDLVEIEKSINAATGKHNEFLKVLSLPSLDRKVTQSVLILKITTYRVGSPRKRGEGLRIGTIREWPRGLKKQDQAEEHFDLWFPLLSPSRKLRQWLNVDLDKRWELFVERYKREMTRKTDSRQALILVAKMAEKMTVSVGCSCEDERYCHRSILLKLIRRAGTKKFQEAKASEFAD
jgi:uncharacterized protein YeaO (DUF488 family)